MSKRKKRTQRQQALGPPADAHVGMPQKIKPPAGWQPKAPARRKYQPAWMSHDDLYAEFGYTTVAPRSTSTYPPRPILDIVTGRLSLPESVARRSSHPPFEEYNCAGDQHQMETVSTGTTNGSRTVTERCQRCSEIVTYTITDSVKRVIAESVEAVKKKAKKAAAKPKNRKVGSVRFAKTDKLLATEDIRCIDCGVERKRSEKWKAYCPDCLTGGYRSLGQQQFLRGGKLW